MTRARELPIAEVARERVAAYALLIQALRRGARLPEAEIHETLQGAGKTWQDLVVELFASDAPRPWSGKPCEECGEGTLRVYARKRRGAWIHQCLACGACGHRPKYNCRVLPAEAVPSRKTTKARRAKATEASLPILGTRPANGPGQAAGDDGRLKG